MVFNNGKIQWPDIEFTEEEIAKLTTATTGVQTKGRCNQFIENFTKVKNPGSQPIFNPNRRPTEYVYF